MNINGRQLKSKWYRYNFLNVIHGATTEKILFDMKRDKRAFSNRELFTYEDKEELMKDLEKANLHDVKKDYVISKSRC